jgi:hypothetical protein
MRLISGSPYPRPHSKRLSSIFTHMRELCYNPQRLILKFSKVVSEHTHPIATGD